MNYQTVIWAVIVGNQIITGWLIAGTCLLKTLSGHSFRVKKNLQTNVQSLLIEMIKNVNIVII